MPEPENDGTLPGGSAPAGTAEGKLEGKDNKDFIIARLMQDRDESREDAKALAAEVQELKELVTRAPAPRKEEPPLPRRRDADPTVAKLAEDVRDLRVTRDKDEAEKMDAEIFGDYDSTPEAKTVWKTREELKSALVELAKSYGYRTWDELQPSQRDAAYSRLLKVNKGKLLSAAKSPRDGVDVEGDLPKGGAPKPEKVKAAALTDQEKHMARGLGISEESFALRKAARAGG